MLWKLLLIWGNADHIGIALILVIIFGMSAAVYTVGGLIQLMLEGEIQAALGQQRETREIDRLSGHAVICGYGRIGQMLADDLRRTDRRFAVIDIKIRTGMGIGEVTNMVR